MFRNAFSRYRSWYCNVGGGSGPEDGYTYGIGCLLRADLVLTAQHVWSEIQQKYKWPVVLKRDGLFRCETAFESHEQDILLLRCLEKLGGRSDSLPTEFPRLSDKTMFMGDGVGFISQLKLNDTLETQTLHTCFSQGYVSFMLEEPIVRYAITSTVIQKGFSGSPVFYEDASLAGVLVHTVSFRADFENPRAPIYVLPVVSPIFTVRNELQRVIDERRDA